MTRCLAALSLALALSLLSGCKGDPKTPEYWEKKLSGARKTDAKVQVVEALRSSGNLQESFLPMLHGRLAAEKRPEVRAALMQGVAMLGDTREQPLFARWAAAEAARTASECSDYGGEGCEEPAALAQKRAETLARYGKVLETAQACGTEGGCWAQKVADTDERLVERAALELGRGGAAQHAAALAGRLSEKDVETRMSLIQALDWLLDSKAAVGPTQQCAFSMRFAKP